VGHRVIPYVGSFVIAEAHRLLFGQHMANEQKGRAKASSCAWSCEAAGHIGGRRLRSAVTRKRSVLVGRVRHCTACYQQHRHRQRARDASSQLRGRHWSLMLDLYEYHRVAMRLLFDRAPLQQIESGIVEIWEKVRREPVKYSYDCNRCK